MVVTKKEHLQNISCVNVVKRQSIDQSPEIYAHNFAIPMPSSGRRRESMVECRIVRPQEATVGKILRDIEIIATKCRVHVSSGSTVNRPDLEQPLRGVMPDHLTCHSLSAHSVLNLIFSHWSGQDDGSGGWGSSPAGGRPVSPSLLDYIKIEQHIRFKWQSKATSKGHAKIVDLLYVGWTQKRLAQIFVLLYFGLTSESPFDEFIALLNRMVGILFKRSFSEFPCNVPDIFPAYGNSLRHLNMLDVASISKTLKFKPKYKMTLMLQILVYHQALVLST